MQKSRKSPSHEPPGPSRAAMYSGSQSQSMFPCSSQGDQIVMFRMPKPNGGTTFVPGGVLQPPVVLVERGPEITDDAGRLPVAVVADGDVRDELDVGIEQAERVELILVPLPGARGKDEDVPARELLEIGADERREVDVDQPGVRVGSEGVRRGEEAREQDPNDRHALHDKAHTCLTASPVPCDRRLRAGRCNNRPPASSPRPGGGGRRGTEPVIALERIEGPHAVEALTIAERMVPGAGLEPAEAVKPRRILSPLRLPVPPPRRTAGDPGSAGPRGQRLAEPGARRGDWRRRPDSNRW